LTNLLKKTLGRPLVAPFLNHDVEHVAMLVDRSPGIENLASDLDHNLIKKRWPLNGSGQGFGMSSFY